MLHTDQALILDNNGHTAAPVYDGETAVNEGYRTAATSRGKIDGRVSAQWMSRPDDEKFLDLNSLRDYVLARSQASRTMLIKPEDMRVSHEDGLRVNDMSLTHWAFNQVCQRTKTPADYLRRLPDQLAAINLQHGLMTYEGEALQAYAMEVGGFKTLRAMTGKDYGRIHDYSVVEQVQRIAGNGVGETRWKVPGVIDWSSHKDGTVIYNPFVDITKENTTLYASDRDIYLFLVDDTHPIEVGKLPNGDPDLMFRGFIVWNSETGSKSFGMTTMLMRGVCQNRNLWGVEGTKEIRLRHSRLAPERFGYQARPFLQQYSEAGTMGIVAKVNNAKSAIVARTDEERLDFLTGKKVGLTKPLAERVLDTCLREEQKAAESVWDMVQGMTATARAYKHQDQRLDLEMKAGKLMEKITA